MPHFIDVSGDAYEQGRAQGEAARREICDNLAALDRGRAALATAGRRYDYERLIAANETFVANESPQTLEEIAGIADGAGVDYRDLLVLNLPVYQIGAFLPMECTQVLIAPPVTADGRTYLAKVRDLRGEPFHQTVLRRTFPNGDWVVEANVTGCITWPGIGVNRHGFAMATSGAWSRRTRIDWDRAASTWLMLNVDVLLRDSHSMREFAGHLAAHPRLTPVICTGVDRESAAFFEVTADKVHRVPIEGGAGVRTNHTHTEGLAATAPTREEYPSTYDRYETAVREIRRRSGTWTLSSLAELLAGHEGHPQSSICRHAEGPGDARTIYASIVRVDDGLSVTIMGNPCEQASLPEDGPPDPRPGLVVVHPPG